jgi:hypothetical protein
MRQIESDADRTIALRGLCGQLSKLPRAGGYTYWRDNFALLARRNRSSLLYDLASLTPLRISLGGTEAATEAATAIRDVGRWWP